MKAAARARIEPDGVAIELPRLRVMVERRQAERLRDELNTVLPPTSHVRLHPSVCPECEGDGREQVSPGDFRACPECQGTGKAPWPRRYLLSIAGDVEPQLSEPLATDRERVEAAQDYRRAHGDEDGLYRLDVQPDGRVSVDTFSGRELAMPKPVARVPVAVGDRVRDSLDGQWREVMSIDPCGTVNMRDGGAMSLAECEAAEKRLAGEGLPAPRRSKWVSDAWVNGRNATVHLNTMAMHEAGAYELENGEPRLRHTKPFLERADAVRCARGWTFRGEWTPSEGAAS